MAADNGKNMDLDFVDFDGVPFTVPESNFVVFRAENSLEIYCVEYERPLTDCLVAEILPSPRNMEFDAQARDGHFRFSTCEVAVYKNSLWFHSTDAIVVKKNQNRLSQTVSFHDVSDDPEARDVRISYSGALVPADGEVPTSWLAFREIADAVVERWMEMMPRVSERRIPMARQCWWVLGGNQVRFAGSDGEILRGIVPSKLGYVGLWQWDAYFIAVGIANGDLNLALEQLRNVVKFQTDTGQLPDVVFPGGVLIDSSDLPEADRKKLEADGSPTVGGRTVPLTKPPLLAWTIEQILTGCSDTVRHQLIKEFAVIVANNQEWWFSHSDIRGEGLPEYLHPYSSGLDDSPVFDYQVPIPTADLAAYLSVQDLILSDWFLDHPEQSIVYAERSQRTHKKLLDLWDEELGMFRCGYDVQALQHRTIVSLLGVFDGRLPTPMIKGVLNDIQVPTRFAANYPLPTVSFDDIGYREDTMWRGPTWINTTFLVADGLDRHGYSAEARRLRVAILDSLERAGGPVEYLNSTSGNRCDTAVRNFSWSAALYIECAVREFSESPYRRASDA